MGNNQHKRTQNVINLPGDSLTHIFGYLPLRNVIQLSRVSKQFNELISSDQLCEDLIAIHNIQIIHNNRKYTSIKQKLLKNIIYDPNDKRDFPEIQNHKITVENELNQLTKKFWIYYPTVNGLQYFDENQKILFPNGKTTLLESYLKVLKEGQILHQQILKYHMNTKCGYFNDQFSKNSDYLNNQILLCEGIIRYKKSGKPCDALNEFQVKMLSKFIVNMFKLEFDSFGKMRKDQRLSIQIPFHHEPIFYEEIPFLISNIDEIKVSITPKRFIDNRVSNVNFKRGVLRVNRYTRNMFNEFGNFSVVMVGDVDIKQFLTFLKENKEKKKNELKYIHPKNVSALMW
jgi:hypothetical protein